MRSLTRLVGLVSSWSLVEAALLLAVYWIVRGGFLLLGGSNIRTVSTAAALSILACVAAPVLAAGVMQVAYPDRSWLQGRFLVWAAGFLMPLIAGVATAELSLHRFLCD